MEEIQEQKKEKKENSRRDFFSGIGIAAGVAAAAFSGSNKANADVLGGDTAVLSEISIWLKTTYATQIAPMLKMITEWYNTVKVWIASWNDFISTFNKGMAFAEQVRNFVTKKEDNWLYQTYVQMNKYVSDMMKYDGDILKYRLHYLNPILINKIDSTMFELQSLVREAENVAKSFGKYGDEAFFRQSKTGKSAIRSTNDHAKYLEAISRLSAIRQTVDKTKKDLSIFSQNNNSPDNFGKLYRDVTAPQMLDLQLLQCSILSEIYAKMNDFFLIMIQKDPIVSNKENVVNQKDLKKFIEDLQNPNKENEFLNDKNAFKEKMGFLY